MEKIAYSGTFKNLFRIVQKNLDISGEEMTCWTYEAG